jgi:hypothetical protein
MLSLRVLFWQCICNWQLLVYDRSVAVQAEPRLPAETNPIRNTFQIFKKKTKDGFGAWTAFSFGFHRIHIPLCTPHNCKPW